MSRLLLLGVVIATMLPPICKAATVHFNINQSSSSMVPGQTSFVDLVGTYDGTDRILGGAISLNFSAAFLQVVDVRLRAPSDVGGSNGSVVISGEAGVIDAIGFASFFGVNGAFIIATVEFRALGPVGVSTLSAFDPGDPIFVWVNEAFQAVSVTSTPSTVSVSPIPEPATYSLWLFGVSALISAFATKGRPTSVSIRASAIAAGTRQKKEMVNRLFRSV